MVIDDSDDAAADNLGGRPPSTSKGAGEVRKREWCSACRRGMQGVDNRHVLCGSASGATAAVEAAATATSSQAGPSAANGHTTRPPKSDESRRVLQWLMLQ